MENELINIRNDEKINFPIMIKSFFDRRGEKRRLSGAKARLFNEVYRKMAKSDGKFILESFLNKNRAFFFEARHTGFEKTPLPLSVQMPCQRTKARAATGITTTIGANKPTLVRCSQHKNRQQINLEQLVSNTLSAAQKTGVNKGRLRGSTANNLAPIAMESPQRQAMQRLPRGLGMESGTQSLCAPSRFASNKKNSNSSIVVKLATIVFIIFTTMQLAWGQCYPDRHSTNAHDGWVSCEESANPHTALGNTHWVLYNLGAARNLYATTFWNLNHPNHLTWGVKRMRFDYSLDSLNWNYLSTYEFDRAPGNSLYEGEAGPSFGGTAAKYILMTPLESYGGTCVGFSEVRFYTEPAPANQLSLNINPCLNDGIIYNINGGINLGGRYVGAGVVNNYDDKFDFDPEEAGPGSHTITYQYTQGNGNLVSRSATIVVKNCGTAGCPPCAPCGNEPPSTFNANPVPNGLFYKSPTINSAGTITTGFDVDYLAGQSVDLQNNFSVQQGAHFNADIRDCDPEPNFIVNGDFENGTAPWVMELHETANAQLFVDSSEAFEGNACGRVEVSSVSEALWHIQVKQFGMSVDKGKSYILSFAAKTDQPKSVWVNLGRNNTPWNGYGGAAIELTNQWQVFTFTVTPDETNIGQTRFSVMLSDGSAPAKYWFDSIKMTLDN